MPRSQEVPIWDAYDMGVFRTAPRRGGDDMIVSTLLILAGLCVAFIAGALLTYWAMWDEYSSSIDTMWEDDDD